MRRYRIQTFGCQMNVHDSRRIEEVLHRSGYEPAASDEEADVILFNTCSVREKAEHKLMSVLGTVRPLKERRRDVVIAVAGCVAQQEGERLLKKAPFVDLVLGPDQVPELPALLAAIESGGLPMARTEHDLERPEFLSATPLPGAREVTSFVTVMKGCDERCTFCVVPTTRGPERYRPADDIVAEIRGMVRGGVREVTLLGQTVNSWYEPGTTPDKRASRFARLLGRIAREVPGLARLRYTSPHPRHLTDELIEAHATLDVLPAHVHLPVQSGSDRVLRRMLRRYDRAEYLERIERLERARPGLTLSTDFIVGFPGETDEDFELTLSLIREAGFVAAFAFEYSPRPHTSALALADDVPAEVKSERLQRLLAQVAVQQSAHLASLVGTRQRVLIEGPSRSGGARWTGRTGRHEIAHVEAPEGMDLGGQIVDAVIDRANKHSLMATLDGPPEWDARAEGEPRRLPIRRSLPVVAEGG